MQSAQEPGTAHQRDQIGRHVADRQMSNLFEFRRTDGSVVMAVVESIVSALSLVVLVVVVVVEVVVEDSSVVKSSSRAVALGGTMGMSRSNRPGRRKHAGKVSMRLVAATTKSRFQSGLVCISSNNRHRVATTTQDDDPWSDDDPSKASHSSRKITVMESCAWLWVAALVQRPVKAWAACAGSGQSPKISDPDTTTKRHCTSCTTVRTAWVLPTPGGPEKTMVREMSHNGWPPTWSTSPGCCPRRFIICRRQTIESVKMRVAEQGPAACPD
jgi:hypothetical protein